MATTDISRAAFDPRKHYTSVRMQQGRVIVDDDWNENERIGNEDRRRSRVDIIGPAGSPDDGFRIANPALSNQQVEFDIEAGAFYVGGLRLELEKKQTYRTQSDWLQGPGDEVEAPTAGRVDLVYLEVYQEPVGAVEDSELFEVALGGPDTSMRLRTAQRVHVLESVEADCCYAWGQLVGKLEASLNEENEMVPDVKLKVTFKPGGTSTDLCKPAVAGGYLGAENQAIRVQLVGADRLTWGFDNAAPLYRVQLDATRKKVTMVTDPKDQAHWPLSGQIVEILPWSAVLPNNEKAAEIQGALSRVDASYNPDTGQLTLEDAIPTAGFDEWQDRSDASELKEPRDPETPGEYYFMRVWDRGADRTSDPEIAFTVGAPVDLGQTGLQVTITGSDRLPGNYWIIAARPETPNRVVPWDFEEGRHPHGVRRFYAPLALIHWKFTGTTFAGAEARDCRSTFRPLTWQDTCCRYTVGDGRFSHGHFDSIEEALKHLPASGGQICLLPGEHRANVLIDGGRDIKVTGCGKHTRVRPREGRLAEPIFQVTDSQDITLEHMDLVTAEGTAVVLEGTAPGSLRGVEVQYNRILAFENGIRVREGVGIDVHHNKISILDKEGAGAGIYMLADDSLIERNDVTVVPAEATPAEPSAPAGSTDPRDPCITLEEFYEQIGYYLNFFWSYVFGTPPSNPFQAQGGVRIGGGSERVKVLENRIRGGAGNGVTLGSSLELADLPDAEEEAGEAHVVNAGDGIIRGLAYDTSGRPLKGVTLSFQGVADETRYHSVMTDDVGYFQVQASAGDFRVSALGYRVEGIETTRLYSFIMLSEAARPAADLGDLTAFLYEIQIEGNEISDMGLSGIGVPRVTLEELRTLVSLAPRRPAAYGALMLVMLTGTFGGLAVNVQILRNHIRRCLQNSFDVEMKLVTQRRGMGGISLALCRNLLVGENRIEDCGRDHVNPTCGVFVFYADQADIGRNQVVNNGPLIPSAGTDLQRGLRGGIVMRLATSLPLFNLLAGVVKNIAIERSSAEYGGGAGSLSFSPAGALGELLKGRQAARVHDNIVEQPVGQALAVNAFGPVSVANNQFNTDFASGFTAAAAVRINNVGSPLGMQTGSAGIARIIAGLANGNTLFNDNQTCLAFAGRSPFSQLITTYDDVGFDGNHSDVLGEQALVSNTLLFGLTLRASDSRFKEPIAIKERARPKLSLLTFSWFLNNTTNNQGNHCIVAINADLAKPEVDDGNQAATRTMEECQAGKDLIKGLLGGLLRG